VGAAGVRTTQACALDPRARGGRRRQREARHRRQHARIPMVTGMRVHDDTLYLASLEEAAIAAITLS
jgi:hypothetical protein